MDQMENHYHLEKAVLLLDRMENLWGLAKAVLLLEQMENLYHLVKVALEILALVGLADLVVRVILVDLAVHRLNRKKLQERRLRRLWQMD